MLTFCFGHGCIIGNYSSSIVRISRTSYISYRIDVRWHKKILYTYVHIHSIDTRNTSIMARIHQWHSKKAWLGTYIINLWLLFGDSSEFRRLDCHGVGNILSHGCGITCLFHPNCCSVSLNSRMYSHRRYLSWSSVKDHLWKAQQPLNYEWRYQ